jgi:hypothetical protein
MKSNNRKIVYFCSMILKAYRSHKNKQEQIGQDMSEFTPVERGVPRKSSPSLKQEAPPHLGM